MIRLEYGPGWLDSGRLKPRQQKHEVGLRRLRNLCVLCILGVSTCGISSAQRFNLPPFREVKLDNGIRLILMEYRRVPTLVITAVFPGGDASDPSGKAGLSEMMADLLTKGTETRTATQI